MKTISLTVSLVLFSLLSFGRVRTGLPVNHSGYVSGSVGYIPLQSNTGTLCANLNVGYSRTWFVEYSQIIGLSSSIYVPKLFLVRSGYSFRSNGLEFHPFIGGGVMPVTSLEAKHKAQMCYSIGCYLVQNIGKDFRIKYEIGIVNKYFVPSIGLQAKF